VPRPFTPAATRAPPPPAEAPSLQGVSILVVEDDPDAQYLIATMLEQAGGRVTAAGSAAQAIEELAAGSFDLLLSDISMRGEDGYSLIRRIRSGTASPRIPALALTANARPEDRGQALASGFQAHMAKPADPAELARVLAALLPQRD
jgi:CheY-like chemotaxis protein